MERDLVGYADSPPQIVWPGGKRLALNLVLNYEEGSERSPLDGDVEHEPLNEATYPVAPGERDLTQESTYEYGSRVGVWRILDLLDAYSVVATIFACGVALERNRPAAAAMVERGHDFVGHGHRWISHFGLDEQAERTQIVAARESIERVTGFRISGWFTRAPQTVNTRKILAQEGFLFDSGALNDDIPYFQSVLGRPFLIVPYSIDLNDVRFWKGSMFTGRDFAQYASDAFDVLYRESQKTPRMMTVGLHARIIGRPGRISGLEQFLEHVMRHEDVWICRRTDLAEYWAHQTGPTDLWNAPPANAVATASE
jgi:peptidoglycan/xylan/chitin deacetylase (PgdA/CDA1 family)